MQQCLSFARYGAVYAYPMFEQEPLHDSGISVCCGEVKRGHSITRRLLIHVSTLFSQQMYNIHVIFTRHDI